MIYHNLVSKSRIKRILSAVIGAAVCLAAVLPATTCYSSGVFTDYTVQPEDVLEIKVYEQEDLNTTSRVTAKGEIPFPLLGKVQVAGMTVGEVDDLITELLAADYLVNPQVQVFIKEYRVKQISVLGSVRKPGKYDMYKERPTTVLEAIAMAEGFSDVANVDGTKVIRKDHSTGEERILPIRITDITKRGKKEKDISLAPGDIVFVEESFF